MTSFVEKLVIITVPCLSDNYAFLVHNAKTGETALIDAPEPGPIQSELDRRGWQLSDILLTHHHWDHIDGLEPLRGNARVIGAAADAHRMPRLDLAVAPGDHIEVCGTRTDILDVSGHTVGHLAYIMPDQGAAFTGDSLMALGCGRVFEGTLPQMWNSLKALRDLAADTLIYSGHEYTVNNAKFALTIEPNNPDLIARENKIRQARAKGIPTVPSTLHTELNTNPFLRADAPELQAAIGMQGQDPTKVFSFIREAKDNF